MCRFCLLMCAEEFLTRNILSHKRHMLRMTHCLFDVALDIAHPLLDLFPNAIRLCMGLIPAVLVVLGLVIMRHWPERGLHLQARSR